MFSKTLSLLRSAEVVVVVEPKAAPYSTRPITYFHFESSAYQTPIDITLSLREVQAGDGDGRYDFLIPIPASLKDGQGHSLRAEVTDTNFSLRGMPSSDAAASSC